MENISINRLMRIINPLSSELKLEMLSAITKSLKGKISSKEEKKNIKEILLNELSGSWSDVGDHCHTRLEICSSKKRL